MFGYVRDVFGFILIVCLMISGPNVIRRSMFDLLCVRHSTFDFILIHLPSSGLFIRVLTVLVKVQAPQGGPPLDQPVPFFPGSPSLPLQVPQT